MSPDVWIVVGLGTLVFVWLGIWTRDEPGPTLETPPTAAETAPPPRGAQASEMREVTLPGVALTPRDTAFFGRWHEGQMQGCRVAVQAWDKGVTVFAGDFDPHCEQITETYLAQASDENPLPEEGSPRRLGTAVGAEALALDGRFFLNASGCNALAVPAVRGALAQLSEHVEEVGLLESGGVEMSLEASVDPQHLVADLAVAISLHRALRSG